MRITRREVCVGAAAAGVVGATGLPTIAATDPLQDAIDAFTGGADVAEGGVEIDAPEIAENGATVPIDVAAEGATSILLLASGNPLPGVATFHFGALSGAAHATTRIRLAGTQDVIAVAKMADGGFVRASKNVKVTIGGCGG